MAAARYSSIHIIFNPNSTGDGEAMAKQLKAELSKSLPDQAIELVPTRFARHAEELSYQLAKSNKRPLIVSASGDGGYNEVVNGIVKANQTGAHGVAGLLPAGNANDHYHDTHRESTYDAIIKGNTQRIDLLKLEATADHKPYTRFAHSYIGFGLTPAVAKELNKVHLNWFNELWIVGKSFVGLKPVMVLVDGKRRAYDSLIFSNVSVMSKVLNLSPKASNSDGLFELAAFKRRHKVMLLLRLLKATTTGLVEDKKLDSFRFTCLRQTIAQLDGEVTKIDAKSEVKISIAPKALECVV